MAVLNRPERLQIMLNPTELKLIDNWRFLKRMPSRASAVREVAEDGSQSKDFGLS
jgi:hypothetical protein